MDAMDEANPIKYAVAPIFLSSVDKFLY